MKSLFLTAIAIFSFVSSGCGQSSSSATTASLVVQDWRQALKSDQAHSITGNVKIIERFPVHSLGTSRNVWIYLPPGYEESDARYPVLYMHDGQNLFDKASSYAGEWNVDESMERLSAENESFRMIVVGVENGLRRVYDYTPYPDEEGTGGDGAKYVDFLTNELKPYIDKTFRTKPDAPNTYIAGSSLGGSISVYAGLAKPETFGNVLAFSNAFQIGRIAFFEFIDKQDRSYASSRFYLDIGIVEDRQFSFAIADNSKVFEKLKTKGIPEDRLKLYVDPAGAHNESSWSRRFPEALKWIFRDNGNDK